MVTVLVPLGVLAWCLYGIKSNCNVQIPTQRSNPYTERFLSEARRQLSVVGERFRLINQSNGAQVRSGITAKSGTVVVGSTFLGSESIYGLSVNSGNQQWRVDTSRAVYSGIAIRGGTAVVDDEGGDVYGIQYEDANRYISPPFISGGTKWIGKENFPNF